MRVLAKLLPCLTGVALAAQQQPPAPDVIRVTVQEVVAAVTVVDRHGNYVNGLEPKDFTVYDNGIEQNIKVDVSFVPISLVVCIQANHAVEEVLPRIKTIGPLLENLVVGEQGEIAVIAFDHRIRVMQDFTSQGDLVKQAIEKIQPGSTTSRLVDTMFNAARMLRNRPKERRRIILMISETQDRGSEGETREALLAVQFPNIMVYTININRAITALTAKSLPPRPDHVPPAARAPLPGGAPRTPTTVAQVGGLGGQSADFVPVMVEIFRQVKAIFVPNPAEVFTRYTGGREYSFVTRENLQQAIAHIGEELHSQYLISYSPTSPTMKKDAGWHHIKVDVHRPGLKVRTREGYWMAGDSE